MPSKCVCFICCCCLWCWCLWFCWIIVVQAIIMLPTDLQSLFGLKDSKDLSMANNIWKMLDDMAESDPDQYKKFVQKNVQEGIEDVKHKKDEKEKPYKVRPQTGFCLTMTATLNEKPLESALGQHVLITARPWSEVRGKMPPAAKLLLTVTHTDRIKPSVSKSSGKVIHRYSAKELKDIELFYYSLQGPIPSKQDKNCHQYCMVLNSVFYHDILNENAGKKLLMSLAISYLQERLTLDKNPLLAHYSPEEYRRLAFYSIDKFSLQISQKPYVFDGYNEPQELLLEKEIDSKREQEQKAKQKQELPKPQIKFKQEQVQQPQLPAIKTDVLPQGPKKVLIEVLKEEDGQSSNEVAYTMKESSEGYFLEFLLPGVASIKELDLEMKRDCIRLKVQGKKQLLIQLGRPINDQTVKAKLKKAESMLKVEAKFV